MNSVWEIYHSSCNSQLVLLIIYSDPKSRITGFGLINCSSWQRSFGSGLTKTVSVSINFGIFLIKIEAMTFNLKNVILKLVQWSGKCQLLAAISIYLDQTFRLLVWISYFLVFECRTSIQVRLIWVDCLIKWMGYLTVSSILLFLIFHRNLTVLLGGTGHETGNLNYKWALLNQYNWSLTFYEILTQCRNTKNKSFLE